MKKEYKEYLELTIRLHNGNSVTYGFYDTRRAVSSEAYEMRLNGFSTEDPSDPKQKIFVQPDEIKDTIIKKME